MSKNSIDTKTVIDDQVNSKAKIPNGYFFQVNNNKKNRKITGPTIEQLRKEKEDRRIKRKAQRKASKITRENLK